MSQHILVLGGARSGKTQFAEQLALTLGGHPAYLATAEAWDGEMRDRVSAHQMSRDPRFATIEEPLDLARAIIAAGETHDVILVDCLTLWISNLLGAERDIADAVAELVAVLSRYEGARVVMVSNEVGQGIVPDNALARKFRDLAGSTHQELAAICDDVYFITAGLPMVLKGSAPQG